MVESGGALGLAVEAFDELGVAGEVRVKDLDGDIAAQEHVAATEDRAHATLADERIEPVGAREHATDHLGEIVVDLLLVAHRGARLKGNILEIGGQGECTGAAK